MSNPISNETLVKNVALAIAYTAPSAGQHVNELAMQTAEERAENLIRFGYVTGPRHARDYDCIIISEERGSNEDCVPPLSEYHADSGTTTALDRLLNVHVTGNKGGSYVLGLDAVSWAIAHL